MTLAITNHDFLLPVTLHEKDMKILIYTHIKRQHPQHETYINSLNILKNSNYLKR
jgi:hypothetical protein